MPPLNTVFDVLPSRQWVLAYYIVITDRCLKYLDFNYML